ncbi:MAG: serine hydrolase domain-containing protein [Caldilineaceae bacterium]
MQSHPLTRPSFRRAISAPACSTAALRWTIFCGLRTPAAQPFDGYGVVLDGELVYANVGVGVRNVATSAPVTADSVFRIASMTKSFTALAIMQLLGAGKRLDRQRRPVPGIVGTIYPKRRRHALTVRQLLAMAPGWPQDDPWATANSIAPMPT